MLPPTSPSARRLHQLRRTLAERVDADLAGIRLAVVPGLPVAGFAFGDLVAVSARVLRESQSVLLHTVGHELAHVFQQRAGRVRPSAHLGRVPINVTPDLEAEAEAAATALVRGQRLLLPQPAAAGRRPVLQPLIAIRGQRRHDARDFSDNFQRLLPLVPQGPAWLAWALRTSELDLNFNEESLLLTGIQLGLHNTPVVQFQSAGLRLAPAMLLDLGDPDFGNIVGSLETGQLTPAALAALATIHVHTEQEFARLDSALAALGASASLAFTETSLADQVLLFDRLVVRPPAAPPELAGAAARFALRVAQGPADFAAAFSFYLTVAATPGTPEDLPAQVWTQLGRLAFPYLKCPTLGPGMPDEALAEAIRAARRASSTIGFSSLAIAIANCAASAGLTFQPPPDDDTATDRIHRYLLGLGPLVDSCINDGTTQVRRVQDGLTRWVDFSSARGRARFQIDPFGLLSLSQLSPAS